MMTYIEAYITTKTPQELIDMARHDLTVCYTYGGNPDRIASIEQALVETANKKNWNVFLIQMKLTHEVAEYAKCANFCENYDTKMNGGDNMEKACFCCTVCCGF